MEKQIFRQESSYIVEIHFDHGPIMFMENYLQGGTHHCLKLCPDFYNARKYKNFTTVKYKAHLVDDYLFDHRINGADYSVSFHKYDFLYVYNSDAYLGKRMTCFCKDPSKNNVYMDEFGQLCEIRIEDNLAYILYLTERHNESNS